MIPFWEPILGSTSQPTRTQKQSMRSQKCHFFETWLHFYLQGRDVRCHEKLANFQSPPSSESLCPSASGAFAAGQKSVWKIVHLVCSVPRPILVQLCHHVPRWWCNTFGNFAWSAIRTNSLLQWIREHVAWLCILLLCVGPVMLASWLL